LFPGDKTFRHHAVQYVCLPLFRAVKIKKRGIRGGGFWQTCQHGCFRQCQILCALAKIADRRRFYTIGSVSHINLVKIQIQNFIFCQIAVNTIGKNGFLELSNILSFRRQVHHFGNLLCNGAAALNDFTRFHVFEHGTGNTDRIKSLVLIKAGILGRNKSMLDHVRNFRNLNDFSVF
jgi:hypothetical protein